MQLRSHRPIEMGLLCAQIFFVVAGDGEEGGANLSCQGGERKEKV